jgi:hypothetical protein
MFTRNVLFIDPILKGGKQQFTKLRYKLKPKVCQSSCRLRHPETMKMDGGWGIVEGDSLRDKVGMFLVL